MSNNNEINDGLLDDAWSSRRFVNSNKIDDSKTDKINKNAQNSSGEKNKKRISSSVKYGKKKGESCEYKPLSVAEQIRIAAGLKQAIVKVTSYGKGCTHIMNHLAYISRNFDIPLEGNNDSLLKTKPDASALLDSWDSIYFDTRKNARDTVNLVFSTPPGTNRDTVNTLTREFLKEEFEDEHDYLFAQHNDTDHPHVHAVIVLRSTEGKKLDPRKQYINQLKKRYAEKCREHGVMLEASRRFERGITGKATNFSMVQMRMKKQVTPAADEKLMNIVKTEMQSDQGRADTGQAIRQARNTQVRATFYNTAKSLYDGYVQAPDGMKKDKDLQAAQLLFDYAKGMPNEVTRAEYLKQLIDRSASARSIKNAAPDLQDGFYKKKSGKHIDLDIE